MDRRASDNQYLHKDFHGALSSALIYLQDRFGPEAVREYLREFARRYYAPVRKDMTKRGLEAMADRLRRVYEAEGAEVHLQMTEESLIVEVAACPAVTHMREHGYDVAPMWRETIRSVNQGVCEGGAYDFELLEYCDDTGASKGRFFRRDEEESA